MKPCSWATFSGEPIICPVRVWMTRTLQYPKVRDGMLALKARELAKDNVKILVEDYNYAVKVNYMINGLFNS